MKAFLKKQGAAFYLFCVTVAAAVLGIVFYLIGAIGGYYNDANVWIVVLLGDGIAIAAAIAVLSEKFASNPAFRIGNCVAVAMFMSAFLMLLSDRILSIGFLLFSELGSENPNAYSCLYLSLAAMALMLIAVIAAIVGGFFNYKKD